VAQQATSDLLSSTEVAARLSVHPRSVARLVRDGDLAAMRVGRGLCFRAADVEDYRRRDAAALDDYVVELVAEAPPLTERQRARLAALLHQSGEAR
jgi:excisionase family DNA binding protein